MKNIEISKVLYQCAQEGKGLEETNTALREAGSRLFVKPGHKVGNALLDIGVGSPEFVVVEDGKLTNGAGVPHQDYVYYAGKTYQLEDDGVTLREV